MASSVATAKNDLHPPPSFRADYSVPRRLKEKTGMPLDVQLKPKGNYLLVKAHGTFDRSSAKLYIPAIFSSCREHKLSNILIDFTEVQGSSMMVDRYDWADSFRKLHSLRVAFVGNHNFVSESFPIREKITAPYSLDLKETTDSKKAYEWLGI